MRKLRQTKKLVSVIQLQNYPRFSCIRLCFCWFDDIIIIFCCFHFLELSLPYKPCVTVFLFCLRSDSSRSSQTNTDFSNGLSTPISEQCALEACTSVEVRVLREREERQQFESKIEKKRTRNKGTESKKEARKRSKRARSSQQVASATGGNQWTLVCLPSWGRRGELHLILFVKKEVLDGQG